MTIYEISDGSSNPDDVEVGEVVEVGVLGVEREAVAERGRCDHGVKDRGTLAGPSGSVDQSRERARDVIVDGKALERPLGESKRFEACTSDLGVVGGKDAEMELRERDRRDERLLG